MALALGALVGLEREYARFRKKGHDFAGIRTYPLIALFGALAAYVGSIVSVLVFVLCAFLMGLLIVLAYFAVAEHVRTYIGATSEVAGFITFFIGALCFYNEMALAAIITIIMTFILYARSMLHGFAEKLKSHELKATLFFAIITFVILPFLPDKGYGPLGLFNPYVTWLMVILVSAISFVGYILLKWFGEKGITLTGILGGLVSSTAVTTSFAQRSKKEKKIFRALVLGVILANGIMFVRVLIVVFTLNAELLSSLLIPLLSLIIVTALFSYYLWKEAKTVKGKVELGSPFSLGPALKFGLLFALILALVKIGEVYFSSRGVYIVSFLSGVADVDAITISLSQLSKGSLPLETARNGILIAVLTNVAAKGGIAYWFGSKEFRKRVSLFFGVLILLGVGMVLLL